MLQSRGGCCNDDGCQKPSAEQMAKARQAMQAMMSAQMQGAGHAGQGDHAAMMQANMHKLMQAQQAMFAGYADATYQVEAITITNHFYFKFSVTFFISMMSDV